MKCSHKPQNAAVFCDYLVLIIFIAELELDRYKFIVQVVVGEQRGEGVK